METLVTKTAGELALQGSGWAVAVILGVWSLYLFRELRASDKLSRELLEKVLSALGDSKTASAAATVAANELRTTVAALVAGVEALSRETEGAERETRHGLANLSAAISAFADRQGRRTGEGRP